RWWGETLSSHESFLGSAVAALYERRILIVFVESAASMTSEMSVALSRFCLDSETTMKSLFNRSLRAGLLLLFSSGAILPLTAAERKEARVTQVVRGVRLLAPQVAARPAHVNEVVTD